jgi:hypothetical protein
VRFVAQPGLWWLIVRKGPKMARRAAGYARRHPADQVMPVAEWLTTRL